MDQKYLHDLDALIERALAGEPIQPVPARFRARLEDRLRVSAVVQKERQRIRFGMAAGAILFTALASVMVFVPVLSYFQGFVDRSVPGGLGYFDYLVVSLLSAWGPVASSSGLLVAGVLGFVVVAAATVSAVRLATARTHR